MQTQLALIPGKAVPARASDPRRHAPPTGGGADWRLDEETRRTARLGLVQARRALEEAIRRTAA
jgi:hypothetical protein